MTIHYHGTPISPRVELLKMAGRNFCVSFADGRDARTCLQIGQSIMFDNGAFSIWKRGAEIDWSKFYAWVEPMLGHPHWAIVPDVIGGTLAENSEFLAQWPFARSLSAPVWHTDEPISRLLDLTQQGWGRICFGSTADYEPGSDRWREQMVIAFNALAKRGPLPWVHMLRGLAQIKADGFPFASADSVNVGRNFKDSWRCPSEMAAKIDAVQASNQWTDQPEQISLFVA